MDQMDFELRAVSIIQRVKDANEVLYALAERMNERDRIIFSTQMAKLSGAFQDYVEFSSDYVQELEKGHAE